MQTWFTTKTNRRSCSVFGDGQVVCGVRIAVVMALCVAAGDKTVVCDLVRRCGFMQTIVKHLITTVVGDGPESETASCGKACRGTT